MKDDIRFHSYPLPGIDPMTASSARFFPRHVHEEWGIGTIDRGGHVSWSGRGRVEAGPGSFICVNPGEVHDGHPGDRTGRQWRMLYLDPATIASVFADFDGNPAATLEFTAPVFEDAPLRRLFDAVFVHRPEGHCLARMACETDLLQLIEHLRRHTTSKARNKPIRPASIERARQRIDDAPAAEVTLADLAAESDLSRYQLLRSFAREVGLTPHAYIVQKRLARARQLLRAGCSLADAAIATGFYDQSHLNRCFVRHFGVTPGRYAVR